MRTGVVAGQSKPINSYVRTLERFGTPRAAARYATRHGNRRDRREQRCMDKALAGAAPGAKVLDLPCGAGRLTPMLVQLGFVVTGADCSPHMVAQAEGLWRAACRDRPELLPKARFEVKDVMNTGYADRHFDVVICNRLFHHFTEGETRRAALAELRRICAGRIIVSFFSAFALDALRFQLRNLLRRRTPRDRIPISLSELEADAQAAGLTVQRTLATRWGISPQWYAVLRAA